MADTLLFERAAIPATNRTDPERISIDTFEKFYRDIEEEGLHLTQCALRWLEAFLVSEEATYLTDPWPKEFLDVATMIAVVYEGALLDRVKAVFNDGSFISVEPVAVIDLEVHFQGC